MPATQRLSRVLELKTRARNGWGLGTEDALGPRSSVQVPKAASGPWQQGY